MPTAFLDTNIWLYAFLQGEGEKTDAAAALIARETPTLSVQVVNEVAVNLLRKAQFSEGRVRAVSEAFYRRYPVRPLHRSTLLTASHLRERYSLSYWDGLIVASALESGVPVLYSEDMQHGMNVDGRLRIENPFEPER